MEQFENGGAGVILYWKDLGRGSGKKGGALTDAVAGVWGSQIYLQLVNFFFSQRKPWRALSMTGSMIHVLLGRGARVNELILNWIILK